MELGNLEIGGGCSVCVRLLFTEAMKKGEIGPKWDRNRAQIGCWEICPGHPELLAGHQCLHKGSLPGHVELGTLGIGGGCSGVTLLSMERMGKLGPNYGKKRAQIGPDETDRGNPELLAGHQCLHKGGLPGHMELGALKIRGRLEGLLL
jgi:hypothetical protein